MATAQSSSVEMPDQTDTDPSDAFDECIWYNSAVCNHCFGHIRDVEEREIRVGKNNQRELEWQFSNRTTDATLDHDVEQKGETGLQAARDDDGRVIGMEPIEEHSALYRETTRTTCLQCGSVGALATDETLSRREALSRVDALVARLREQGFSVSKRYLRETIRRGKTRRDTNDYDREIFAAAVTLAIRHG